ncbi:hypothetical protein [Sphaerochaeta sp. PS]|uniref:hypothetical protein n=1 Tax=Sphaerochaeta sp. PS TaxID=3076336 RepID=UPI0028A33F68|nr:hypothetical protein [Sphaerochaeta sp. PS]MDT4760978.1 hypothetical protein [Sphaerochaeta sp. PS]
MARSCHSAWESKCTKCGLCCHEKAVYGRLLVIDLDSWCEFFDPKTKQCTIYAERFTKSKRCKKMTFLRAMFASYIPDSCAYAKWAKANHIRFAPHRMLRIIHSKNCPSDESDKLIYTAF